MQACYEHFKTKSYSATKFIHSYASQRLYIYASSSIWTLIWVLSYLCDTLFNYCFYQTSTLRNDIRISYLSHLTIYFSINDKFNTNYFSDIYPSYSFYKTYSVLGGRCCVPNLSYIFILTVYNITVSYVSAYSSTWTAYSIFDIQ